MKHKEIPALGYGLVTRDLGVHCMVQWSNKSGLNPDIGPVPTLEACHMLEIINASR